MMFNQCPLPDPSSLRQQRVLVAVQRAEIVAAVCEDERSRLWLSAVSTRDGMCRLLNAPMVNARSTNWSVAAVAGRRPIGADRIMVMAGAGRLLEATLGPGVWLAIVPDRAQLNGVLFLDNDGNVVGQYLAPPLQSCVGSRYRLRTLLGNWMVGLPFVKLPRAQNTYQK